MTLATHAVVGGAMAALFPSHPVAAFFAGFFGHYVFDTMPHWDYKILSKYADPKAFTPSVKTNIDKNFGLDILRIGADAFLGILIVFSVWHPTTFMQWEVLALGVVGGVLPDFLQFVYIRFPHQPMVFVQKFHDLMHADYRLDDKPLVGILLQITLMVCVTLAAKYLVGL
jgi:hypothetical protein